MGVPSRPSPGSDPGPIQVPSRVRRGPVQIRHVLCFTARTHPGPEVGAIPARPGPILVPSVPSGSGLDGPKQTSWPLPILAWPPLQSLAVKKSFIFCKFWAVKNFYYLLKSASENFAGGLRGAKNVSVTFRIVFRVLFRVFQTAFRAKLKQFGDNFVLHACRANQILDSGNSALVTGF